MKEKNSSKMTCLEINQDTNHDEFKILEAENCCSNNPIYEITYNHISRKWFLCHACMELNFFKTDIKEKVRIQL